MDCPAHRRSGGRLVTYHATRPGRDIADRLGGILAGPDLTGAACARRNRTGNLIHDPDLWFPNTGGKPTVNDAVRICRWCPAIQACADWAMANRERNGIWGGLTERQRDMIRWKKGRAQ